MADEILERDDNNVPVMGALNSTDEIQNLRVDGEDRLLVNTAAGDTFSTDAFGRQRVSNTGQRFDVEFIYDKQVDIMDEYTVGDATVTHDANARDLTLAVGSDTDGDIASMDSYPIPYTAGNSQLIDITGVLDYANLGNGNAELFFRTKISGTVVTTTYDQSTWENCTTGINWNYSHILAMDFQSLKVGRIRFFLVQNGAPVKLLEITNDNKRNTGYWQLPSLPVSWSIYNDDTYTYMEMGYGDSENGIGIRYKVAKNASATMKAICATVKSEGGADLVDLPGFSRAVDTGVTAKTVSTTLIPILSIRADATYKTLTNHSLVVPTELYGSTNNPIRFVLIQGGSLTGASWTDVDTSDSSVEYDVTASAISGGVVLGAEYFSTTKNTSASGKSLLDRALLWYRTQTDQNILTIAAVKTGATNASVLAGFKWKEIR